MRDCLLYSGGIDRLPRLGLATASKTGGKPREDET